MISDPNRFGLNAKMRKNNERRHLLVLFDGAQHESKLIDFAFRSFILSVHEAISSQQASQEVVCRSEVQAM